VQPPHALAIIDLEGGEIEFELRDLGGDSNVDAGIDDVSVFEFTCPSLLEGDLDQDGQVTASDIANAVSSQAGITLDRKSIQIASPIRTVGDHSVSVELFAGITGTISLTVSAS